jgi:hypothetical protein
MSKSMNSQLRRIAHSELLNSKREKNTYNQRIIWQTRKRIGAVCYSDMALNLCSALPLRSKLVGRNREPSYEFQSLSQLSL